MADAEQKTRAVKTTDKERVMKKAKRNSGSKSVVKLIAQSARR